MSHKSVPQKCPTRASYKSTPECPTKVPEKIVSYKSVPQKCLLQECQKLFGCLFSSTCLHSGSWVPFCFLTIATFWRQATSGINGAGTKTQKTKSIPDNAEIFIADTLKGGAKKPELAKVGSVGVLWTRMTTPQFYQDENNCKREPFPSLDQCPAVFDLDVERQCPHILAGAVCQQRGRCGFLALLRHRFASVLRKSLKKLELRELRQHACYD